MASPRITRPPFRADHVGSLLRPPALRQAFRQHGAGEIDAAARGEAQDRCIREAVAMQEAVGLEIVSDGEFRRGSYWGRFVERMEGFAIRPALFKFRDDAGHEMAFTAPYAVGRVRRGQPLALDEFLFLREIARATAKITLPAPSTVHFYRCSDFAAPGVYDNVDSFFADVAAAFRAEIAALGEAGCRYVQLDEVAVALLCDPAIRAEVEASGHAPDRLVDLYIDAINAALAGRPADMTVGVHMCRGNFKGHYLAAGGYASVAERFFANTDVDHFLLEYDTPRAGDFAPLRFVPKEKGVVLGLISTKIPALENIETLRRRVDEAARHIDVERLAISPQCGFASTAAGNPLSEADQRAKLALVVQAAAQIWN
jgi:5-methyltetrahydropteroyltriglutamate--homocysteine methyltransferase